MVADAAYVPERVELEEFGRSPVQESSPAGLYAQLGGGGLTGLVEMPGG
jgi:hypothetical protein